MEWLLREILKAFSNQIPRHFQAYSRAWLILFILKMLFGIYTDRGPLTCDSRPGSYGHELLDAQTYAAWGVDYVKEDSCHAPTHHDVAYKEYALMRDSLNSTGRSMFFSLCGWNSWYGPVGMTLGNSWRTGPDDKDWSGILNNIDILTSLYPFAGPGGWNDPCMLLGRNYNNQPLVTDQQGRAQFTMWAMLSSPLLLSQNVRNLTTFQLQTYLNKEVIAVSQDPLGRQARKLSGGFLSAKGDGAPPLTLQPCGSSGKQQSWTWNNTAKYYLKNKESGLCAALDNCAVRLIGFKCVTTGGSCAGPSDYADFYFYFGAGGTIRNAFAGFCVTQNGIGNSVTVGPCLGTLDQIWSYDASTGHLVSSGGCLTVGGTVGPRASVWGKPLADGTWAISFINADSSAMDMTCGYACLSLTGWDVNQEISVRDLWAQTDLPNSNLSKGISVSQLAPDGGIAIFRIKPVWKK